MTSGRAGAPGAPAARVSSRQSSAPVLLDSRAMAEFVARGFLRVDAVVPSDLNVACLEEMRRAPWRGHGLSAKLASDDQPGSPISSCFADSPALRAMLDHPVVAGAIESLLGPDPLYDHHAVHVRYPGEPAQRLHADSIIDTRLRFDVQMMYFPHDVSDEMGGTLLVPGSHLRRVNEHDVARYQNLRGQVRYAGPAGSVLFLHHGLWHCGRRNRLDEPRYMFKLRLNPAAPQVRRWATGDLADEEVQGEVVTILRRTEPWMEWSTKRLDLVNRIALWRYLTDDPGFDFDRWYGRLENAARPGLLERLPGAEHPE